MIQSEVGEPPSKRLGVVVLAAGQGTRMGSSLPKVLHPVAGRPMIQRVLDTARALQPAEIVVVTSPQSPEVRSAVAGEQLVEQHQQLGTGHAVLQAREQLDGRVDRVLVLYGDTPLVRSETAQLLLEKLGDATLVLLSAMLDDPTGYGRIVRDACGSVIRVVEQADTDLDSGEVHEVNSGLMAFRANWLWEHLPNLPPSSNGEYYLTDLVRQASDDGVGVAAVLASEPLEAIGINSQAQLAAASRLAWSRTTDRLMAGGVTVLDPPTTYVDDSVEIASGTMIHPNTYLQGATRIGQGCQIGPGSTVIDSIVGDHCRVWLSVIEGSRLEENVQVGPFSHVRPDCHVEADVRLGNYSEAKASRIGRGTQVHHFSYLGDALVGERVNIGAGTITCNFDGLNKHQTVIGDEAFIGSDSMLVAPIVIGAHARTGAGSVVTHDVPDGVTVVGVPARALASGEHPHTPDGTSKDGE